jgi:uncharacterized membrane protein YfcA
MRKLEVTLPELGLIAGTRAMLGAGIGLLVAPRLGREQRRAIGWTLLLIGIVTTLPLVAEVFGKSRRRSAEPSRPLRRRYAEPVR